MTSNEQFYVIDGWHILIWSIGNIKFNKYMNANVELISPTASSSIYAWNTPDKWNLDILF